MAPKPDNARPTFEDRIEGGQRELVMVKNGHRYVFRCAVGREADMLAQLGDMIRARKIADAGPSPDDPANAEFAGGETSGGNASGGDASGAGLDWFDAAVISHQIGRHLADRVNRITKKAS